jgi:signal transduction histidine kinase
MFTSAVWTAYGVLASQGAWLEARAMGSSVPLLSLAGPIMVGAWLWALFTPVVFAAASRFSVRPGKRVADLAAHGILFSLLTVLDGSLRALAGPLFGAPRTPLAAHILRSLDMNLLGYAAIVAAAHALGLGRRFERDRRRLVGELARAELADLRMQMQPHFLFNALHAISEIVHEDPAQAEAMLAHLAAFLRRTMQTAGVQEVALQEELDLLGRYLAIQEVRLGKHLTVDLDLTPEAGDAMVPNFLLQPLVENAISHGFAGASEGCRIQIHARREEDRLLIEVKDNGRGLPPPRGRIVEGLGLTNTRARLQRLYGSDQSFVLVGRQDRGVTARIVLPYRTES